MALDATPVVDAQQVVGDRAASLLARGQSRGGQRRAHALGLSDIIENEEIAVVRSDARERGGAQLRDWPLPR